MENVTEMRLQALKQLAPSAESQVRRVDGAKTQVKSSQITCIPIINKSIIKLDDFQATTPAAAPTLVLLCMLLATPRCRLFATS